MSGITLNTIAQKIAAYGGKPNTVEEKELEKAGFKGEKKQEALKCDTDGEKGLSLDEFLKFLGAQTGPYVISTPEGDYRVSDGKIEEQPSQPEGGEKAGPAEEVNEKASPVIEGPLDKAFRILQELSPHTTINKAEFMKWCAKWFKDGELCVDDGDFKEGLAQLLTLDEDDITDGALDAIFGNHDGKLNDEDMLTQEQFLERMQIAKKVFSVRSKFGENFAGFLRRKKIYFVNMTELAKGFSNNQMLLRILMSHDACQELKEKYLEAAGEAYVWLAETDEEKRDRQFAVNELKQLLEKVPPANPEEIAEQAAKLGELEELLFYAYLSDFERTCIQKEIEIEEDIDFGKPNIMDAFVKGIFGGNFILSNYSILPQEEDGDYADDKITEELILELGKKGLPPLHPEDNAAPEVDSEGA